MHVRYSFASYHSRLSRCDQFGSERGHFGVDLFVICRVRNSDFSMMLVCANFWISEVFHLSLLLSRRPSLHTQSKRPAIWSFSKHFHLLSWHISGTWTAISLNYFELVCLNGCYLLQAMWQPSSATNSQRKFLWLSGESEQEFKSQRL